MIKINVACKLMLAVIIAMLLTEPAICCDTSCKKASVRAMKQYGNKVEKAEDRSCKIDLIQPRSFSVIAKFCKKELRYLDIRYDGYSDLIKSNPEIEKIRVRHLALHSQLENLEMLATAEVANKMISSESKFLDSFLK